MAGFLKTSAISLVAALSTAAAAQTFEPWDANTPPQTNPNSSVKTFPVEGMQKQAPTASGSEQRCRDLAATAPLKQYPKAGEAFLQADGLGCRFVYGLDKNKPLLEEAYNLENRRDVSSFKRDVEKADRKENRATPEARERPQRDTTTVRPHYRRDRAAPARETSTSHLIGNPNPKPAAERRHSAEIVTPATP